MTNLPTSFVAHLTTAAGKESIVLSLNKIQLEIWGLHSGVPWMLISDYISKGTVTQTHTEAGAQVIVNWSSVQFVTYDNPWEAITSDHAIKIPR